MTPSAKTTLIKSLARRVGFDLVGITHAGPPVGATHYREWLARGYGGKMDYLAQTADQRCDPAQLLPGIRSVICTAVSYRRPDGYVPHPAAQGRPESDDVPQGRVAQYARGQDYHTVLHRMLARLVRQMRTEIQEPFEARVCVDTMPVLEREFAARAGLGWIGKNTCLLHPELGSYLLLGELLTTLELTYDEPIAERCARCTRCLDVCPTQALIGPREMDARRCIAYLTIEHHSPIAPEFHPAIGDCVFGCDLCQQVCPYNAAAPNGSQPEIMQNAVERLLDLRKLVTLGSNQHRQLVRGTALRRAPRRVLVRNAELALQNVRRRRPPDATPPPASDYPAQP